MYKLKILVNGKQIPIYYDRFGNSWVEARKGTKFEIKITNEWWNRCLAIVSVDGLNVINAQHEVPEKSPGYIVNRWSSVTIPGWKINEDQARDFMFVEPNNTYASKIGGDPNNVGVIGLAVYDEKINYRIFDNCLYGYNGTSQQAWTNLSDDFQNEAKTKGVSNESLTRSFDFNTSSFGSCSTYSCDVSPNLGVGSGEKHEFETERAYFERGSLCHTSNIYYDDRAGLLRRGIIVERGMFPKAFPEVSSYCPDV
jgi:hypothetical protein